LNTLITSAKAALPTLMLLCNIWKGNAMGIFDGRRGVASMLQEKYLPL
jgi:hypothetical protein